MPLSLEYVGELIFEPTTHSRQFVLKSVNFVWLFDMSDRPVFVHGGRNYLFQLDLDLTIDSMYAGNETRSINHGDGDANVIAKGGTQPFLL